MRNLRHIKLLRIRIPIIVNSDRNKGYKKGKVSSLILFLATQGTIEVKITSSGKDPLKWGHYF